MRTVAATRPADGTWSGQQVLDKLMELGFEGTRALRILAIANEFGVKAEALPKGMITITVAGRARYRVKIQ